jgi:hypothetical protein
MQAALEHTVNQYTKIDPEMAATLPTEHAARFLAFMLDLSPNFRTPRVSIGMGGIHFCWSLPPPNSAVYTVSVDGNNGIGAIIGSRLFQQAPWTDENALRLAKILLNDDRIEYHRSLGFVPGGSDRER